MSKAEELAKKYCEGSSFEDACMEKPAYIAGYHQAEKDLKLTCEDVEQIYNICCEVFLDYEVTRTNMQKIWKEVLKRFNKERNSLCKTRNVSGITRDSA